MKTEEAPALRAKIEPEDFIKFSLPNTHRYNTSNVEKKEYVYKVLLNVKAAEQKLAEIFSLGVA